MVHRYRLVVGIVAALTAFGCTTRVALRSQEPDILREALKHPLGTPDDGVRGRFGDPDLDAAEMALHDYLPRPWTVQRIRPLFEAAAVQFAQARKIDDDEANNEWEALVLHLGRILASSRDPRAALALGRVVEGESFPAKCSLAESLRDYFADEAGYQRLPNNIGELGVGSTNLCPYFVDDARGWFQLNRQELEKRAAALSAASPPCTACDRDPLLAVAQLRARLGTTAPRLHLSVKGERQPRFLQIESIIGATSGHDGDTQSTQRIEATSSEIPIEIPGELLGRNDVKLRALVMSPGFQSVVIDVHGTTRHPVIPVTLTPLPSKVLTGTVAFAGGAVARPFVLGVDLRVSAANDAFGIFAHSMSTIQGVAEAAVDGNGRFRLVIPDVARDHLLAVRGNRFVLSARDTPLVLDPREIEFDYPTDAALNLSASPRTPRR